MKSTITSLFLLLNVSLIFGQVYPFPNHTTYAPHIKPNTYNQTQLDNHTKLFYDDWKFRFFKNDCGNTNEYYVYGGPNNSKNVSEGQGYGMMIAAYFAGHDPDAQMYFDGLYRFYKSHPSMINSALMDWQQVDCNDLPNASDDSASDGDIDIAFGLLLANSQWGSDGAINYLAEAQTILAAIMQDEINPNTWTVKLGDWSGPTSTRYYGTRPSDFITDHFRAFSCYDSNWDNVINICYTLVEDMQTNFSATTGLIPDFIVDVNTANPNPAPQNYLESTTDGQYSYNSCRVPWRLGTDYLLSGELRAKTAVNKINTWLLSATGGSINTISDGYDLDGTPHDDSWRTSTFVAPFAVGAMLNPLNQDWLNSLYGYIQGRDISQGGYYQNTIKLLSMLVISGNYWLPSCNSLDVNNFSSNKEFVIFPNPSKGNIILDIKLVNENVTYKIVDINGKILMTAVLSNNRNDINISSLETGMYFISITINNKTITRKIIKE